MSEPLIVIGNGMAAARLVEELAKRALGRYAVAVIGDEPRLAYNRVLLSALLAEEVGFCDIELKPARWWRDRGVTLRYGMRATAVDPIAREVTLSNGTRLSFSKLVFATGSQPIKLAIAGMDLPGVLTFRDIDDVNTIAKAARARVVVIGGGLLGLEAAYGLAKARAHVTVLHLMDRLMERQLDERAARLLKRAVEAKGIAVRLEAETTRIIGNGRVEAVELRDGSTIAADAVVVAAGIRANTALARTAGLKVNGGIVVDDHLETNLKVSGVNVFSAGDFLAATVGADEIVLSDPGIGVYKKLVIGAGRLIGAVLFGDTADGSWYLDLIRSGSSIERLRDDLVFGRDLATRVAA